MCHVTYGHYFTMQDVKIITRNIPHKLDISPDSKYPQNAYTLSVKISPVKSDDIFGK